MRRLVKFALVGFSVGLLTAPSAQAQLDDYDTPTEEEISGGQPRDYSPPDEPVPARERPPEESEEPSAEVPPEDEEAPVGVDENRLMRDEELRRARRKFRIGLRGGYGAPLGDIESGVPLANDRSDPIPAGVSGLIPIWLDLGYMAFPKIMLGFYARYGVAFFTDCPRCSGRDIRFGIQLQYHFQPSPVFDPWLGVGFGYEFLNTKEAAGKVEQASSFSAHGFEFVNLQAGLDIELAEIFTLGPFVSFSLNQFSSRTSQAPGASEISDDIGDTALHMWLEPGLKGTLSF